MHVLYANVFSEKFWFYPLLHIIKRVLDHLFKENLGVFQGAFQFIPREARRGAPSEVSL